MQIDILDATRDHLPIIQNMGRLYVYDISEFMGWRCPPDGLYGCRDLAPYWDEPDAWPFLIQVDGELAGFAMINTKGNVPETDYNVGEFFILRKFRRRGVGTHVARALFARFPGNWEVMQLLPNAPAIAFWRSVVAACTSATWWSSGYWFINVSFTSAASTRLCNCPASTGKSGLSGGWWRAPISTASHICKPASASMASAVSVGPTKLTPSTTRTARPCSSAPATICRTVASPTSGWPGTA